MNNKQNLRVIYRTMDIVILLLTLFVDVKLVVMLKCGKWINCVNYVLLSTVPSACDTGPAAFNNNFY